MANGTPWLRPKAALRTPVVSTAGCAIILPTMKSNRLVALFDILGFGNRLQTDSLASIRRDLRLFIRTIRSEAFTNTSPSIAPENDDNLDTARFVFDSVLLISHEVSNPRSIHNFV